MAIPKIRSMHAHQDNKREFARFGCTSVILVQLDFQFVPKKKEKKEKDNEGECK